MDFLAGRTIHQLEAESDWRKFNYQYHMYLKGVNENIHVSPMHLTWAMLKRVLDAQNKTAFDQEYV